MNPIIKFCVSFFVSISKPFFSFHTTMNDAARARQVFNSYSKARMSYQKYERMCERATGTGSMCLAVACYGCMIAKLECVFVDLYNGPGTLDFAAWYTAAAPVVVQARREIGVLDPSELPDAAQAVGLMQTFLNAFDEPAQ